MSQAPRGRISSQVLVSWTDMSYHGQYVCLPVGDISACGSFYTRIWHAYIRAPIFEDRITRTRWAERARSGAKEGIMTATLIRYTAVKSMRLIFPGTRTDPTPICGTVASTGVEVQHRHAVLI